MLDSLVSVKCERGLQKRRDAVLNCPTAVLISAILQKQWSHADRDLSYALNEVAMRLDVKSHLIHACMQTYTQTRTHRWGVWCTMLWAPVPSSPPRTEVTQWPLLSQDLLPHKRCVTGCFLPDQLNVRCPTLVCVHADATLLQM